MRGVGRRGRTSGEGRGRIALLAAGLAVTAGATATTLLGATPAFAQTNSVTMSASAGTLNVVGTGFGDSITANGGSGTVTLSNLLGSIKAGAGCTQLGATVRCTGVSALQFSGLGGDDTFRNNTSTRSFLSGGAGSDRITGGPGRRPRRLEAAADRYLCGSGPHRQRSVGPSPWGRRATVTETPTPRGQ